MATRNERKKRARVAKALALKQNDAIKQSLDVKRIVAHNRMHGIERNFYSASPMGTLKEKACFGRVAGLSRLAPLPDAKGNWWEAIKAK